MISDPVVPEGNLLDLVDWRRRTFGSYDDVRRLGDHDPEEAWRRWREARDRLFSSHPQSPIPADRRDNYAGNPFFPYDPAFRVAAAVEPAEPATLDVVTSGPDTMQLSRFAVARFALKGVPSSLELFWITGYGGGLFLSFRDGTSGSSTYGACRYLLDTIKGADLGRTAEGRLILDFNFSYNPSCAYDPRWVCPLAPPANRLDVEVTAGELAPAH